MELVQYYDPIQTVIVGLSTYLLAPLLNGDKNYFLFGQKWDKKLYAALEMSLADFLGQWVSYGPGKLISGTREPLNAVSAGVIYGLERKFLHKNKSFVTSAITGTAVDSVGIVLTEPLTKLSMSPKKPIPRTSGAAYTNIISPKNTTVGVANKKNATSIKAHKSN